MGPRFISPFRVVARVDKVEYRLDLHVDLSQTHNTFHVSQLWKCLIEDSIVVTFDEIQVDECLNYVERAIAILDRKMKTLRNKLVSMVMV